MKISLEALQVIDAIERQGSFTAAAAALHRVPSAISHAMAKLEADLGIALFIREGRRAILTPAGRTLLDDGRPLLLAAEQLERRAQGVAAGWATELSIALNALFPVAAILPLIQRFYATKAPTRIRLSQEVLGGSWDAVATGRADLVIGASGDKPAKGGISSRILGETRLLFCISPDHPLAAYPDPIPVTEMVRHRAVVIADTSRELAPRTSGLQDGQDTLRVPTMEAKAAAQAAGLGIGSLPRWLAEREIAAGRLVTRPLQEEKPLTPLHLVWRTRQECKALGWFLRELSTPATQRELMAGL